MMPNMYSGKQLPPVMHWLVAIATLMTTAVAPSVSVAAPATYDGANLREAAKVLGRRNAPKISGEVVSALEKWIALERERGARQAIVAELEAGRKEWQAASDRMNKQLADVVEQAEKDAVYRRWAGFFAFVATTAEQVARLRALGGGEKMEKPSTVDAPPPKQGDTMTVQSEKRDLFEERDGEWRKVKSSEIIQWYIHSPDKSGRAAPGRGGTSEGSLGRVVRGMGDTATAYLQKLDEAGVVPYCSEARESCVLVKEGGDDSWQPPGVLSEIPQEGELERLPNEAEKDLYRAISDIMTPAEAGSLAMDLTPGVGELKSAVELSTGRDPITGDKVHPGLAAIGLIPAAGPKVKAGLKGGKTIKKIMKGGTQAKWINRHIKKYDKNMTINQIIEKHRNISIKNVKLEPGTPPWPEIGKLTWAEFLSRSANKKKFPAYYKSRGQRMKLLTDNRFKK